MSLTLVYEVVVVVVEEILFKQGDPFSYEAGIQRGPANLGSPPEK